MPAKASKGPKELKCAKCAAAMEPGMIMDRGAYNISLKQRWTKGGLEFSWKSGLKTSSGPLRSVATWRCTSCGFLESYAS
jgi:hypothetical protein